LSRQSLENDAGLNELPTTLILPVENQTRELDAKLLLACVAAERGYPVIIGSRALIHHGMASYPRGVYLAKSMRTLSEKMFSIIRLLGHEIVAWDEEALVRSPDDSYYARRLSPKTMKAVSALFAWGPDDARVFRDYPGYSGAPIHITGNPRIDVMREDVRGYFDSFVTELNERYGNFILINTNFGWANHYLPKMMDINANATPGDQHLSVVIALRRALYEHFRGMVPMLSAAFPERTILVRPHPIESHEPWQAIASQRSNVIVTAEGNVVPWLMACDALVHNGCTTAVEAAVLGTPAVAYQPVKSDQHDDDLPNGLSHSVPDDDSLCVTLRQILAGSKGALDSAESRRLVDLHIGARDGELAADRMVSVLDDMGFRARRPPSPGARRHLEGWARTKLRTASKKLKARRKGHRNSIEYHDHRFPEIPIEDMRSRVERFARQLGRFKGIRVTPISRHVFRVKRAK
jgi:surface carbohydrate biosynthesis protein